MRGGTKGDYEKELEICDKIVKYYHIRENMH